MERVRDFVPRAVLRVTRERCPGDEAVRVKESLRHVTGTKWCLRSGSDALSPDFSRFIDSK